MHAHTVKEFLALVVLQEMVGHKEGAMFSQDSGFQDSRLCYLEICKKCSGFIEDVPYQKETWCVHYLNSSHPFQNQRSGLGGCEAKGMNLSALLQLSWVTKCSASWEYKA